ncbi:glutamate--ammonia ligase [Acidaminococcus sp. CAG:917]|nr:glutamate--ammonia ligase [Acidaminococcus sp. CAG:917]
MSYSEKEVMQYCAEEDVKFIRLAFCDVFGVQKNISVMPSQLPKVFKHGIAIDASAIDGFGQEGRSDLFLYPDPSTLTVLPWRPEHGRVVRMFCRICNPDKTTFINDTRSILVKAVADAKEAGYNFNFGSELEFYLFKLDEKGNRTYIPHDDAGYMDIAPDDRGENVRREICLTLEQMEIVPEGSHHEEGPGQNEIDFEYSDPLTAADRAITFKSVVKTIAARNGLYADFSPKPLTDQPGSGFHVNISVGDGKNGELMPYLISGILDKIREISLFLNPSENSYERLGSFKAPKYVSWSIENRSQLIRIPAAVENFKRLELRSPDPTSNPYIGFALLIYACIEGLDGHLPLPEPADINFYTASEEILSRFKSLPLSLEEAKKTAAASDFVNKHLPSSLIDAYLNK